MKIVSFFGGLGNQLFIYAYYSWLKEQFPNESFYGFYPALGLSSHNGLEVNKCFNIELPPTSFLTNIYSGFLYNTNRLFRRLHFREFATCTQQNKIYGSRFHCDYWQDIQYIPKDFRMKFLLPSLSVENESLLNNIAGTPVAAIHVRRGDYFSGDNASIYGGICTEAYYESSIEKIRRVEPNVNLLFFSDDSNYVRKTFAYQRMIVVDWNKGENSIIDMYLMSRCEYMVLANSSFSYWAALLNTTSNPYVVCPKKWINNKSLPIQLDSWIKIDCDGN